jgi:hypothetical protein
MENQSASFARSSPTQLGDLFLVVRNCGRLIIKSSEEFAAIIETAIGLQKPQHRRNISMNGKHSEIEVEKMTLSELSALEAGVVRPVRAPHEDAPSSEAEKRSREVKREIGSH